MSIHTLCTPRPSVHAADRRATVLNLDTFLKGQVSGAEFFEENYFTHGMLTLVDRAFRHLGGSGAGSSVFLLSQAMGGGKTHSMIALGLLARGVTAADTARANLLATIAEDVSYEMMLIGPSTPITNQDIVKAQSDPESIIEKYWPGAMKVLLENNLKAAPHDFWPPVNIDHARRILGWEPELTFESWLRKNGWG